MESASEESHSSDENEAMDESISPKATERKEKKGVVPQITAGLDLYSPDSMMNSEDRNDYGPDNPPWIKTDFLSPMTTQLHPKEEARIWRERNYYAHEDESDVTMTTSDVYRYFWGNEVPIGGDRQVHTIVAARNHVVAVQVSIESNCDFMFTTDYTNWLPACGHVPRARLAIDKSLLAAECIVDSFIIGYVEDEEDNLVMETLVKRGYSVNPSSRHNVYIRIRTSASEADTFDIPLDVFTQAPGFEDEELQWSGKLVVQVADVLFPSPKDWRFHLDLWQHLTSIARFYEVQLWSIEHFNLINEYFAHLSTLGQKAVSVVATEMPWIGQHCYLERSYPSSLYEHAILQVTLDGGEIKVAFDNLDKLLQLAKTHNIDSEIEIFGVMSVWSDERNGYGTPVSGAWDYWRIRYWDEQAKSFGYIKDLEKVQSFICQLYNHFLDLGLAERVRICADEPTDIKLFHSQLEFIRNVAPGFNFKVAINHYDFMQYVPSEVLDYVPLLPLACKDIDLTRKVHEKVKANGGRLSSYVCCAPSFPNNFVSSPLSEGRLMGYIAFFLQLDGVLRWNYCLWPAHPAYNLKWRSPKWRVGDMYFVLPGSDGKPIETLRAESLRFGVQEYELLKMAEESMPIDSAQQLFKEVRELILKTDDFSKFAEVDITDVVADELFSVDPANYETAKNLIIEKLALSATKMR